MDGVSDPWSRRWRRRAYSGTIQSILDTVLYCAALSKFLSFMIGRRCQSRYERATVWGATILK